MDRSLGMVEYRTVSLGMRTADLMVKTAMIDIIEAKTISPGKFIVIFSGELGALNSAIEASVKNFPHGLVDKFILGNPHDDVIKALKGKALLSEIEALGIIETFTAASSIIAADIAAKSAVVKLADIRITNEMCGKAYVLFSGTVSNVTEASNIACAKIKQEDNLIDFAVIPNPDEKFWKTLL